MKLGSLCSGAGGLDLAVEQIFDAETVWHCELDPAASKVLAYRWPGVPNHGDLIATDWGTVEPVDIICAGWPCQPFSMAGKRKGHKDERAIWPHIADAVRMVRPRYVVLENVSTVLVREFGRVCDSLASLGYDITWACLRASDVGAPHRRERLFVLAHTAEQLSPSLTASDDHPTLDTSRAGTGARDRAGNPTAGVRLLGRGAGTQPRSDADVGGEGCQWAPQRDRQPVEPQLEASQRRDTYRRGNDAVKLLPTPRTRDGKGGSASRNGDDKHYDLPAALLQTPSTADGDGGHLNRSGDPKDELLLAGQAREMASQWGKYESAIRRWESLTRPAPAPTEPNRNNNPRLNPAFSEWMMGWPDGWVTDPAIGIGRNDALRIIGNGVIPQQAAAAITHLLAIRDDLSDPSERLHT